MTTAPEHAAGWTLARTETLMVLWADGKLSARDIANELGGGVSRNGVIGKAHRLKLSGRPTPLRVQRSIEEKLRHSVRRRAASKAKARAPLQKPAAHLPLPMPIPAWDALPGSTPIGLMELSNNTCRWPLGKRPFRYCGCEPVAGSSYCGEHRAIATRVIG